MRAQGLHPRARTPARSSASPRPRRASRSTPWSSTSSRRPTIVAAGPQRRRASCPAPAPRGSAAAPTPGVIFMRLKPRDERTLTADAGHRRAAPEARRASPASASICRTRRPSASADSSPRASTSTRCRTPDTNVLYQRRADARREDARASRPAGREQRPAAQEPAGASSTSTATRAAALGVTADCRSRPRSTPLMARGRSRTIYAPTNEYQVIMELLPEYQSDPSRSPLLYVRSSSGQPGAALARWPRSRSDVGPLTVAARRANCPR